MLCNFLFSFQGHLDKTNVSNISTLRSIQYGPQSMNVYKASEIGTGLSIPYKHLKFESNMRIVSSFESLINNQGTTIIQRK